MTVQATSYEFVVPTEVNPLDPTTPFHAVNVWQDGDKWVVAYNYDGEVRGGYHDCPDRETAMATAQDILRELLSHDPRPIDPDAVVAYMADAW